MEVIVFILLYNGDSGKNSLCNGILYYKNLLLLECIQLVRRPKKNCIQMNRTEGVIGHSK